MGNAEAVASSVHSAVFALVRREGRRRAPDAVAIFSGGNIDLAKFCELVSLPA